MFELRVYTDLFGLVPCLRHRQNWDKAGGYSPMGDVIGELLRDFPGSRVVVKRLPTPAPW